jgi:hypothetical protein
MEIEVHHEGGPGTVKSVELSPKLIRDIAKMTAVHHLRRLLEAGCECVNDYRDNLCFYCHADFDEKEPHKPNCPHVAAKAFVEELSS